MKIALCNEVFRDTPIEETIAKAARLGYDGVEIAPFTIASSVEEIPAARRASIREAARRAGIEIAGLHWLLASPPGLHMTAADAAVRERTYAYLRALLEFCGDVGGTVVVLGSPKQRSVPEGVDPRDAWKRAVEGLRTCGPAAKKRGVTFCFEPLHARETNFINTAEEAWRLVGEIGHPSFSVILDMKAMSGMPDGIVGTIRKYGARAGHFHANDPSGVGPGMGDQDFFEPLRALRASGYRGWISVEPFVYEPDPETVARTAVETIRRALAQSEA